MLPSCLGFLLSEADSVPALRLSVDMLACGEGRLYERETMTLAGR